MSSDVIQNLCCKYRYAAIRCYTLDLKMCLLRIDLVLDNDSKSNDPLRDVNHPISFDIIPLLYCCASLAGSACGFGAFEHVHDSVIKTWSEILWGTSLCLHCTATQCFCVYFWWSWAVVFLKYMNCKMAMKLWGMWCPIFVVRDGITQQSSQHTRLLGWGHYFIYESAHQVRRGLTQISILDPCNFFPPSCCNNLHHDDSLGNLN